MMMSRTSGTGERGRPRIVSQCEISRFGIVGMGFGYFIGARQW
jgi:hypothetical protein